jgi:superfamily II DNA or RNA helicase
MILDNRENSKTVHEWLSEYTSKGQIDAVTGYFTVGALAWLSHEINDSVSRFRFIIGDIVSAEVSDERPLDLLSETIGLEGALNLNKLAKEAVAFLRQEKVLIKTMEPNFCHAKAWLCRTGDAPKSYYITGSSNLTEAGLGLKETQNLEMNLVGQGTEANFAEIKDWFAGLWERKEAHTTKTVDGKKVDFKQYLIDEISLIFRQYTPRELYYKTLFELFGRSMMEFQEDPRMNREVGRLEHSVIWKKLYEFQRKGVLSLIQMLEKYSGAILADAVGLGKTWSALAIAKYYQSRGYDIILLCPKRLDHNWRKFLKNHDSCFEKDELDYVIRYHTDLQDRRLETHRDGIKMNFFRRQNPKLFIIDESHNLRNSKSNRYQFLVEEILEHNDDIKVLLLSATPINNSLIDVRNQFKLLVQGRNDGFRENLGISNIDSLFGRARKTFKEWGNEEQRTLSSFIHKLPTDFFALTDALVVARTRKLIAGHVDHLEFPDKGKKPENIFLKKAIIGEYETFQQLIDALPTHFAAYMPTRYIEQKKDVSILHDEQQRDTVLVKLMHMLLVKRLESSWKAFYATLERVAIYHENIINKLVTYNGDFNTLIDDGSELAEILMKTEEDLDFTIGKRAISIADIAKAGKLDEYRRHLIDDHDQLRRLLKDLAWFEKQTSKETGTGALRVSKDEKLSELMRVIRDKQNSGANYGNRKLLIFTAYADTAHYLYNELNRRGVRRAALVTGQSTYVYDNKLRQRDFEPILERFAPYTKLFLEKEWANFTPSASGSLSKREEYLEWCEWIRENDNETAAQLDTPVDILIATDCLSEGQNLQDCDLVVNYDIHWNPVRIIQRLGRIDRLGSPNQTVFAVNFWPTAEINEYLSLQRRIEDKMAQMVLVGSEVRRDFTDGMVALLDEDLEHSQEEKLLKQMAMDWTDIEDNSEELGFDKFSLEIFRQDLLAELDQDGEAFKRIPNAVYSGFSVAGRYPGLIALLGYPARKPGQPIGRYQAYDLIYVDHDGIQIHNNPKDILTLLDQHKDDRRMVPAGIDYGDSHEINVWSAALQNWLTAQTVTEVEQPDGSTKKLAGAATMDFLHQLQHGSANALKQLKKSSSFNERFDAKNLDLVLWFTVTGTTGTGVGKKS